MKGNFGSFKPSIHHTLSGTSVVFIHGFRTPTSNLHIFCIKDTYARICMSRTKAKESLRPKFATYFGLRKAIST